MAAAAEEARLLAWLRGPAAPGGPELAAYVSELAALGLAELGREPARLAAERARVGAETRRLAFEHYRAFIRSAECTGRAGRGFGGIESRLGSLLERLPALQDACRCGTGTGHWERRAGRGWKRGRKGQGWAGQRQVPGLSPLRVGAAGTGQEAALGAAGVGGTVPGPSRCREDSPADAIPILQDLHARC